MDLSQGIALLNRNINVKIYEQAHKFGEIGAGVSFGPTALDGMRICNPRIFEAFDRVVTYNCWPSKRKVWFDFLDATSPQKGHQETLFSVETSVGQNGVHRAHFIDELMKLFPAERTAFEHHLDDISDGEGGRLVMHFRNGKTATADAVIGCDGIKSRVRQIIVGDQAPSAHPHYTHHYAYRGLIPMQKAVEAVGEERAMNASFYIGPGGHVLTFPVDGGEVCNLVAFKSDPNEWPDFDHLTRQGTREDALRDLAHFGTNVHSLLQLCPPELAVWAIFDNKNPVPTFSKGRIAFSGDAAHATSPHHGSGAGFAIEDSAVLAELLSDPHVKTQKDLEAVFATFDACRRSRTQWLVQSSRFMGEVWDLSAEGIGNDIGKVKSEIDTRNAKIVDADMKQMCSDAKAELAKRLK